MSHAGHSPDMFREKFWLSLVLAVPILYFSEQVQVWLGYQTISFPTVEVTRVGEETTLSQIQRLVAEALSAQLTPPGSAGSGHPS
jgi:hypothetical protein